MTVVLCFSQNVAYMPLSGRVTAVTEHRGRFAHSIPGRHCARRLGQTERLVLESALQELETYLQSLEMPGGTARASARATLVTTNPRSILSLFITDNPYHLTYRSTVGNVKLSGRLAHAVSSRARPRGTQKTDQAPYGYPGQPYGKELALSFKSFAT